MICFLNHITSGTDIMASNFQEAPLPLVRNFKTNDHVILISAPAGNPPIRYRLDVKISVMKHDVYHGFILSVENADDHRQPGDFYRKGNEISFEKRHILGGISA